MIAVSPGHLWEILQKCYLISCVVSKGRIGINLSVTVRPQITSLKMTFGKSDRNCWAQEKKTWWEQFQLKQEKSVFVTLVEVMKPMAAASSSIFWICVTVWVIRVTMSDWVKSQESCCAVWPPSSFYPSMPNRDVTVLSIFLSGLWQKVSRCRWHMTVSNKDPGWRTAAYFSQPQ